MRAFFPPFLFLAEVETEIMEILQEVISIQTEMRNLGSLGEHSNVSAFTLHY